MTGDLHRSSLYRSPMYRRVNDTRGKPTRTLIRVFVQPGSLPTTIAYYERLQGLEHDAFFPFPQVGLYLAMVGSFLIIEGSDEDLAPFRQTTGTLLVDDAEPYYARFLAEGAEILWPIRDVPTGRAFNVRHPDGSVIEYVHHRPDSEGR
ncbi:VOC family protein [Methylobacterium aquaticum]|uniref:VOC family protein n=1 Tax=Methylobacterium aquaticum TaxID=270351 RepID=UPI0019330CC0|nr:hypothetical protein [Methylobacterium aquaticum]